MKLPLGQLIQGASNARNAYVGGQKQRQQDDLANALMARKLERETQEQSLRDALTRAQTNNLLQPKAAPRDPVADHLAKRKIDVENPLPTREAAADNSVVPVVRDGKVVYEKRTAAVGQEAPRTEPQGSFSFPTVMGPDGTTVVARANNRSGEITPTDIGAKPTANTQKLTEAQEKSHLFYNLMANSEPEILAAMASKNIRPAAISAYLATESAGKIPVVGGVLSAIAKPGVNSQLTADEQKLIRAGKDFTAGVLRKESGAAVSTTELMETLERMFPGMFGDRPELTEAKNTARAKYMRTMKEQAGPALEFYANKAGAKGGASDPSSTNTISPAERKALKAKGWTDAEIDASAGRPDDE